MSAELFGGLMGKQKRPHFAPEFRLEAAQLVVDQGYSVEKAADAMGVGRSTMSRWVKQLRDGRGGRPTTGAPVTDEQRQIRELQKRIRNLEMEKDILKKATALLMSDEMNNLR